MKSIIDGDVKGRCYRCARQGPTERHHIFGAANRKWSEKYGLTVQLCHFCHNEPPKGVHHNRDTDEWLKRVGQTAFEVTEVNETDCTWEEARQRFMQIFGKNYM